jgi:hypothetical protein
MKEKARSRTHLFVEDVEDDLVLKGTPEEHDGVLLPGVVGALQQPQAVPEKTHTLFSVIETKVNARLLEACVVQIQCCGSMKFWYGSGCGPGDLYLWGSD